MYLALISGEKSSKSPRVSGSYAAKVSVRRVFRGERDRLETNHVIVEGLGNPKICFSDPKIGESFIFLTDRLNEHQFDYPLEFLDHVILRYKIYLKLWFSRNVFLTIYIHFVEVHYYDFQWTTFGSFRKCTLNTSPIWQLIKVWWITTTISL